MIPLTDKGKALASTLCLGAVLGLWLGWFLWHPLKPIVEAPAPSQRQPDGALLAARRPDTVIKVVHRIPPGFVPERTIAVGVQPDPVIIHDTIAVPGGVVVKVDTVQPPPVQLQLSMLTAKDGSRRVLLSAKGGKVLDSLTVDVPLGPAAAPARKLAWSAGPLRSIDQGWGAYISHDTGPFRILAGALQGPLGGRPVAMAGVGLRF